MNSISDKSRKGLKFKFEPDKMIINFLFSKKASKAADVLLPAIMISYSLNKFSKEPIINFYDRTPLFFLEKDYVHEDVFKKCLYYNDKEFGKDSIEHINIPMIIASVRSESLSQGGKFVLDWAGISGPRLEYRQSFDAYHNKILHNLVDGYMPFPLKNRKFKAICPR